MKNIAKFAIGVCVFAALLSQTGKECVSQAFSSYDTIVPQDEGTLLQIDLSEIQGILLPYDFALPQDEIAPSQAEDTLPQDEEVTSKEDMVLSQTESTLPQAGIGLSQEFSSVQNHDNAQKICNKFIAIGKVEVFVDNIRDEHIESQIKEIASAVIKKLIANRKQAARELEASIVVRQRSYYKKTKKRNSIYVYYSICDKNGERLAEDWHIVEGRDSIISAAVLARQIKKTVREMKRQIKNCDKKSRKNEKK